MTDTATPPPEPATGDVLAGAEPAPNATPAGAVAYFTGPDGSIAWLDLPASYEDPPEGFLRVKAEDPATTVRFTDAKVWAAEVERRGLVESDAPQDEDPAAEVPPEDEPDPEPEPDDADTT